MTDEDFEKHVEALATRRLELPKKLSRQNGYYWGEIVSQQYNFDRDNIEVTYLRTISKKQVLDFYKVIIFLLNLPDLNTSENYLILPDMIHWSTLKPSPNGLQLTLDSASDY